MRKYTNRKHTFRHVHELWNPGNKPTIDLLIKKLDNKENIFRKDDKRSWQWDSLTKQPDNLVMLCKYSCVQRPWITINFNTNLEAFYNIMISLTRNYKWGVKWFWGIEINHCLWFEKNLIPDFSRVFSAEMSNR